MKKLINLLFLILIIGLGNLFAQTPMPTDTLMNPRSKVNKDSMMSSKNKMYKDSGVSTRNTMNKDSGWSTRNTMSKDSGVGRRNNMSKDSMQTTQNNMHSDSITRSNHRLEQGVLSDNGGQKDSTVASDSKMKEGNMMASNSKMKDNKTMMTPDVSSWPEASKMAVDEITAKYGKPDGVTGDELIWLKKGVWNKICISKMESKHSFPIEHTDMMQTTISYDVPEDKMDDLGKFDGSVTFDRTQGTMSARCDKEGNNFLALNLANDIVTGKKTVVEARKLYGDIIKLKMKGGRPAYMEKLGFTVKSNTADPDKNTTGLTKEQVTKAIELNAKN